MAPMAPAPRPVILSAIIQPGEILKERPVLVSIGEEGTAPQLHKGDYSDLVTLIEVACENFFVNGHGTELAAADLQPNPSPA